MPSPQKPMVVLNRDMSRTTVVQTPENQGLNAVFAAMRKQPVEAPTAAPVDQSPTRPIRTTVLPPTPAQTPTAATPQAEVWFETPAGEQVAVYAAALTTVAQSHLILVQDEDGPRGFLPFQGRAPVGGFQPVGAKVKGIRSVFLLNPPSITYKAFGKLHCLVPIADSAPDTEFAAATGRVVPEASLPKEPVDGEAISDQPGLDAGLEPYAPEPEPVRGGPGPAKDEYYPGFEPLDEDDEAVVDGVL